MWKSKFFFLFKEFLDWGWLFFKVFAADTLLNFKKEEK